MSLKELLDQSYETTAGASTLRKMIEGEDRTVFIAYPMDYTLVCTRQLCSYRDHWDELSKLPCKWWGINQGDLETHQRFKKDKDLPFDLVVDSKGLLLRELGLYGFLGTRRGFAVTDPEGKVIGSTSIFPFFYPKYGDVIRTLSPWLMA